MTMHYTPPLRDFAFVLDEVLQAPQVLRALPAHAEIDGELMMQVLEEAGRFAADVVAPLNGIGDREGCRLENGTVTTPPGFERAYAQFCAGGWPALACAPEHGGQGLPHVLDCALYEMLSAANHGWTMYPGLLHGAYACLAAHGSPELQARYLEKIASGQWLATMCLTEAQAGSDLGQLRTRAVPQEDGSYRLSGDKIFISGGEHDLTPNIVHLVLARLPDALPGSKGLSLFLAPRVLDDGSRNGVHCTGIEHKMGIHGSATCSLHFEQAQAWLVGEAGRGLAAMFVMMNAARLHVGAQGLGLAEAAWQRASAYARERRQSRAPGSSGNDLIVRHPAVQKLLMEQRCRIEGARLLTCWAGLLLDLAEHDPDAAQRRRHHERLEFITPVIKAFLTDQGFQCASRALQVFGGHGYVVETGIEQFMRDARITMIYEGTNEIQAIDFLMRKVLGDEGRRLDDFLTLVRADIEDGTLLGDQARLLANAVDKLSGLATRIASAAVQSPSLPYYVADEMLRLTGHVALGWMWLRAGRRALSAMTSDPAWYGGKRDAACYHFAFVFAEVHQLSSVIEGCLATGLPPLPTDLDHHAAQEAG
ncbi:acyl-CoA dehydrogenase family protein [Herbaspirillum huttiense]|uniref:acyl-CoA dehydrogenase family protein n=1 Tax=Herbaspirillum huttiense TaxID=863372 RepID=UPI002176E713|nr:acyl-CoA dehydrogenase family protein [Herbaspirillum huttiense]UWE15737.1 acyl-CoA dehydrogenase family protein [Herbaspirillum huttiense]